MSDLHGFCLGCSQRIDTEDILDHARREHPELVDLSVSSEFLESMSWREQSDTDVVYGFGRAALVDIPVEAL